MKISQSKKRQALSPWMRPLLNIRRLRSAFKGAAKTWRIKIGDYNGNDIVGLLKDSVFDMEVKIQDYQSEKLALKFTMALHVVFIQSTEPDLKTDPAVVFNTDPFDVCSDTNIAECLTEVYIQLLNDIDIYERNGSGWVLNTLETLDLSYLS